jgi:hypothetical protein
LMSSKKNDGGSSGGEIELDEDEYDRLVKDPYSWYRAGQKMDFAAKKILKLWKDAMDLPKVIPVAFNDPKSRMVAHDIWTSRLELFDTHLMLMGYAIENTTKGLDLSVKIVDHDDSLKDRCNSVANIGLKYHDSDLRYLTRIAKRLKIVIGKEEKDAAKLAVDHVLWAAKYPVDKKAGENISETMRRSFPERPELEKYADSLETLYLKLEKELTVLISWLEFNRFIEDASLDDYLKYQAASRRIA